MMIAFMISLHEWNDLKASQDDQKLGQYINIWRLYILYEVLASFHNEWAKGERQACMAPLSSHGLLTLHQEEKKPKKTSPNGMNLSVNFWWKP